MSPLESTQAPRQTEIADVAVPEALLRAPDMFGGVSRHSVRVGTLIIAQGRVVGMRAGETSTPKRILLPRLTEAHVHLDKCHTIDRCADVGGDLMAASAAQLRDKELWTRDDLAARMGRGLDELRRAGCGAVRTHIDWDTTRAELPLAWEIATELAQGSDDLILQPAALTAIDDMADTDKAEAIARRVAQDGGVLGAFVLTHPKRREGIRQLFALADRFGLALDFHVDESLDPTLDGIDLIVETAREMRHEGPVLCGHVCTLAMRPEEEVTRLADGLAESGIAIASLPTTNLYLQGRTNGTPVPRGITRLHELKSRGVRTVIGTDNVRDAFCPVGRHDPLHSLGVAVLAAHLDPPFGDHLPMITTDASAALGLVSTMIDDAQIDDLLIFETPDLASLLSGPPPPLPLADFMKGETCHG